MASLRFAARLAAASLWLLATPSGADAPASAPLDGPAAYSRSQQVIGRPVRDLAFVDTRERPVRLSDYRGRPLVVSLVYTGCTNVCRATTQFLSSAVAEARAALGEGSFAVVTIGFNQPFDTPQAMAAFARQNGVRDAAWAFLSTDAKTIDALTEDLGFTWAGNPMGIDHLAQITLLDAEGVVRAQLYGDALQARELVEPLKRLLEGRAREAGLAGVWDKVKLFCTVYDPRSGRYRLDYSLFVELFAGATILLGIAGYLAVSGRGRRSA